VNETPSRRCTYLALILIVGLSAYVRFVGLRRQGIIFYDEAAQLMEARFLRRCVFAFAAAGGAVAHTQRLTAIPSGVPLQYGKPVHTAILAAAQATLGDCDWAGQAASAALGTATVLLCFWLASGLYGTRAGLAAALLLGLSGYHVMYSRQALAEADSVSFFVLAVCLYLGASGRGRNARARLVCVGLCVGLSYAANYRWFFAPVLFWSYEILSPRRSLRRFLLLSLGMALPLIAIETLFSFNRALIMQTGANVPCQTYFQQIWHLNFRHPTSAKGFNLSGLPTYVYLIARLNGPMGLVALCAGLIAIAVRCRRGDGLVLSQFGVPFLFFTFHIFKYARFLSIGLPALAILSARGIVGMSNRRPRLGLVLLAATAFGQLLPLSDIVRLRSGYPAAVAYMKTRGIQKCFSTEGPILQYYLGVVNAQEPPGTARELLAEAKREDFEFILLGPLQWRPRFRNVVRFVDARLKPAARFPNPAASFVQYAFEHNCGFARTLDLYRELRDNELVLYSLQRTRKER